MRTTLTLDDQLAKELKEVAHKAGKPFKEVVNDTLRKGLHPSRSLSKRYRLKTVSLGAVQPGINLDKALSLADAIEDEEIARKLDLRK
jgi:metal-responsive CopG/Arc/MetJ family transcriptional regulator